MLSNERPLRELRATLRQLVSDCVDVAVRDDTERRSSLAVAPFNCFSFAFAC